jgi:hypothetical protein
MHHRKRIQGSYTVAALILSALAFAAAAGAEPAPPAAVDSFVQSHAAVSEWTNQIGRWFQPVCPQVSGLKPEFARYVSDRVVTLAGEVGVPTQTLSKSCTVNVQIMFTPYPQQLLDRIAADYRPLLGFYYQSQRTQVTTFTGPIQAWYITGTQSLESPTLLYPLLNGERGEGASGPGPVRIADSRLHQRLRSEILRVTIIADANALTRYSLPAIADYVSVLSLTRMTSMNSCEALPSIIDLLAANCAAGKAGAMAVTPADLGLLKALYSADLEGNLNLEQRDLQVRMRKAMVGCVGIEPTTSGLKVRCSTD